MTALRSISGRLPSRGVVEIVELQRRVETDEAGNFLFRALPAGALTVRSGAASVKVSLSKEPVSVKDVVLGVARATPAPATASKSGEWLVQLGAFREASNVADCLRRARAAGIDATARKATTLTFVEAGPYTRGAADAAVARAAHSGLEAVVVPDRHTGG